MPNGVGQDVYLTLDFDCCRCGGPVSVMVKCSGQGVAIETEDEAPVASTSVPCPGCGQVNQLFFDSTGCIRAVKPFRCFRPLPVPSVN
jgi:hypothetical protein